MKKLGIVILILLIGVLGVFLSPYYTLYQIKSAYENGDYAKAVSYVDFEQVGQNTKTVLTDRLNHTLTHNSQLTAIGNLMPNIKDDLTSKITQTIDESVNEAITADNLQKSLAGELTKESKKLVAIWAFVSDYVDYEMLIKDTLLQGVETAAKNQEPVIKERIAKRLATNNAQTDTKMRYCGLHCFEITGAMSGVPIGATMSRVGIIGWKVDKIELP